MMKRIAGILFYIIIGIGISYSLSFAGGPSTVTGKIVMLNVEGAGNFYYLKEDTGGREIFLCGVGDTVNEPSKQWIKTAEENGDLVSLKGNIIKNSDNEYSFADDKYEVLSPKIQKVASSNGYTPIDNYKLACAGFGPSTATVGQFFNKVFQAMNQDGQNPTYNWKQINQNTFRVNVYYQNPMTDRKFTDVLGFTVENNLALISYYSSTEANVNADAPLFAAPFCKNFVLIAGGTFPNMR